MRIILLSSLLCLSLSIGTPAAQPKGGSSKASGSGGDAGSPAELRGIWMHATAIKTPAEADAAVAKIDRANLNAVFLLVWYWGGQAFFQSTLCPMGDGVQPGYDPLGYMIQQCHKRGIQVHAWFVNGAYGASEPKYVLDKHPDWIVDDGGGGVLWYDFGKPEVRRFQSDLIMECVARYDLDGIHLDYVRYGPHQCYCSRCQTDFARRYGTEPLIGPQRTAFPTGVGISANPLIKPTTAVALATFSDGTPAIALNMPGKGIVLLLNWHAENEMPPAVAETVKLVLGMWSVPGAPVNLMTTKETRDEYGNDSFEAARVSMTRLGHPARSLPAERVRSLPPGSIVVLPAVYLIPRDIAEDLERFVRAGGKLLVIDGPAKSMHIPAVRHITGFAQAGPYIRRDEIIESTGRSPLVPKARGGIDQLQWKYRMMRWAEFRKQGVTELVREIYRRVKMRKPDVQVSAAVFSSLESADSVYQDWPRWLNNRLIDYVIPMAYTSDTVELARQIGQWKTVDRQLQRIVPGLALYDKSEGRTVTRSADLIRAQQQLCQKQGAHGNMYFSLQYMDDPVIALFGTDLYPSDVPVYSPPPRWPARDRP